MIVFGLTGGIACGKSTVTKTFRDHNIPMVDADIVARQVVEPGTEALSLIVESFGSSYLLPDGTMDRVALGSLVFAEQKAMDKLNAIMAPAISFEGDKQVANLSLEGHNLIGWDAALIIEMGNAKKYKPLIVVQCPAADQLARLMKRNALTAEEAMRRISAQMPTEQKVKLADFVVDTSGTIENSIEQTKKIIHQLHVLKFQKMLKDGEITYNQVPYPYRDTMGNDSPDE